MTSDPSSWREAKAPRHPGQIYDFRRGYRVEEAGRHESEKQFRAFQIYLNLGGARSLSAVAEIVGSKEETISDWSKTYNWQRRVAKWDQKQITLVMKDANKIERQKHRAAIEEFRVANEEQARVMMGVSSDLMLIIQNRIAKAQEKGEEIPMALVSGLMRAAANISDSGRQAWATALGVNELMQVVENELEEVNVVDVTDIDPYEIPLDED